MARRQRDAGARAMTREQGRSQFLAREAKAIRRLEARAAQHTQRLLADVIEMGRRLDRVKKRIPHGDWLPWLKKNFAWTDDTALNYVRVFRSRKRLKSRTIRDLPLSLIFILAREDTPPAVFEQVGSFAKTGKKLTVPIMREIIKPYAAATTVAKVETPITKSTSRIIEEGSTEDSVRQSEVRMRKAAVKRLAELVRDRFVGPDDLSDDVSEVDDPDEMLLILDDIESFIGLFRAKLKSAVEPARVPDEDFESPSSLKGKPTKH
jgi:hypothetical protein